MGITGASLDMGRGQLLVVPSTHNTTGFILGCGRYDWLVHYYNLSSIKGSSVIQHLICVKDQKDYSFNMLMIIQLISFRRICYSGSWTCVKKCTSDSNIVPLVSLCWVQLEGAPRSSGSWCIEGTAYFPPAPQSSPGLLSSPHHR
jgi:hypothetical protein